MDLKSIPTLHVDGSVAEYVDNKNVLHKVGGIGGYLVLNGKIIDKFSKKLENIPNINHHEDYAIIEGLKWVKSKNINAIKVKTDSLNSVSLFNNQKKFLTKDDKFFLMQFFMLEFSFDILEINYHSRNDDDLSHQLSRNYLKDLPVENIKIHNIKKKQDYIEEESLPKGNLQKILCESMKEIHSLIVAH